MPPPPDRAAADGYIFADGVVVADHGLGRLAAILQILRRNADGAKGMKGIARADAGAAVQNNMGDEAAILAQHHFGSDRAKGTDRAGGGNYGSRRNDRAGMNAHSGSPLPLAASAGFGSRTRGTIGASERGLAGQFAVNIGLALHTAGTRLLNDSTSTSMRN